MTRRVESFLLTNFLGHWKRGDSALEELDEPGQRALQDMCRAVEAILAGVDPDEALRITRLDGAECKPHTYPLAVFVHHHKYEKRETWPVVHQLAADWLRERGKEPISEAGLKQLYRRKRADIESALDLREQVKRMIEEEKAGTLSEFYTRFLRNVLESERDLLVGIAD